MAFSGPELSDYENVVSLNEAWLGLVQGDTRLRSGLAGLPEVLIRRLTNLTRQQIVRLAETPFLLFSFRERDDRYWTRVLSPRHERDLFSAHDTDAVDTLVSASLGFIWQLARRNPYTLRLICGATLYWTECIAEQTFLGLLEAVRGSGEVPVIRFVNQREMWRKLLDSGVSPAEITRQAAQLSALQAILTDPPESTAESWSLAARLVKAPQMCVADGNEPTQSS
ncbi:MAG: hypothetical protein O3A13_00755 [Proteobacteria bacterium]|nr:hypothetical protein [Pseudomonadota bacterium]